MKHKFRIGYIYTELFSEIEKLSEITDESLKNIKLLEYGYCLDGMRTRYGCVFRLGNLMT